MITKRTKGRKDGKSSCSDSLRYGEGLAPDRKTGELLDKSHRTRFGNFGLVDDDIYIGHKIEDMAGLIELAAIEMQANCDLNTRVGADKKLAQFIFSFNQEKPSEAVLRDIEDSMLAALALDKNHFATFLHNDNGYWHLHIFASRIEKEKPHRGNALWKDMTIRDRVCREIEIRHNLVRDNGLHEIKDGQIVEIPFSQRIANREAKPSSITDKAKTTEIHSGEKTFQTWCNEIRIGDRLKHAKSWQDLHAAAAAYGCEVKQKGAGFVICPQGEKGGIQLSKMGLKNLPAKFGAFQIAKHGLETHTEAKYKPSPTNEKAASHYDRWRKAKDAFKPIHTSQMNEQREAHKKFRADLRTQQKTVLEKIRSTTKGESRFAAVSVAKMAHSLAQAAITEQFARERQALRNQLKAQGPGNTFRDYLINEAMKGDNIALGLARKYGADEATDVLRQREADRLKIVASIAGQEYKPAQRLSFTHRVERSGSVVFDLGLGRKITDSPISKKLQLNAAAANNPEAIAVALRFATTKFGNNTLTLSGSPEFQRLAVETAVRKGLSINFKDPALQAYKQELAASLIQEKNHVTRPRPYQTRGIPPAHRRDRLHQLSEFTLATEPNQSQVLLPKNVFDRVADRNEEGGNGTGLRRPDAGRTARSGQSSGGTSTGVRSRQEGLRPVVPAGQQTGQQIGASQPMQLHVSNAANTSLSNQSRAAGKAKRKASSVAEMPVVVQQPVPDVTLPLLPLSAEEWAKAEGIELGNAKVNCIGRVEFVSGDMAVIKSSRFKPFLCKIPDGVLLEQKQLITIAKDGTISLKNKEIHKER